MAGIYIHIPFCKQACYYCNFHFSTQQKSLPQMVDAIQKEAILRKEYIAEKVATIYFGGGTPSLCTENDISRTIDTIRNLFHVDEGAEITIEANPDDITPTKLDGWRSAGINRLSIGIQSFLDKDLQWMHRAHNARQAIDSILLAKDHGFHNISADLIYGTPTLNEKQWQQNVETITTLNIPHISCYALTVEPKTALAKMIQKQEKENTDGDKQALHFELLVNWLQQAGYEHYEISNFAKPGYRSKHNSSYWQGKHYLGLGPSAHSFNGYSRQWNVANNAIYLESINQNLVPFEKEDLTTTQQLNEYIMTSLRTIEGTSLHYIENRWGKAMADTIRTTAVIFIQKEMIILNNHSLQLTKQARFLADGIASEFFILE